MSLLPGWLKLFLAGSIIVSVMYSTWYVTSDHYQKRIAEIQLQTAEAVQKELMAMANRQNIAEKQHAKDQIIIDNLRAHPERLRLDKICGSALSKNADRDRRAWLFPEKAEAAFAEFQRGLDDDLARCDQLNIDAIRLNSAQ